MSFEAIKESCFFRYRNVNENTMKELESGQIWHSRYEYLNDPFEFPLFYDEEAFQESDLEEFFSLHMPSSMAYLEDMKKQNLQSSVYKQLKYWIERSMPKLFSFHENACVACFSGNPSDGLMWSHYSDELKGICIAYNKEKLAKETIFDSITPIDYREDVGQVTFRDLTIGAAKADIEPWPEHLIKETVILPTTPTTFTTIDLALNTQSFAHALQKHKRWKYEDENRSVVFPSPEDMSKPGVVIDAGDDVIDAIIIGEKAPTEDLKEMITYTNERGIPLFVARANKRTYQVEIDAYSDN